MADQERLSIVYPGTSGTFDGIQQHGERLVDAFAAHPHVFAELFERAPRR